MLCNLIKKNFSSLKNIPKNILIPDRNKLINFKKISIINKENDLKNIKYALKYVYYAFIMHKR